jgi:hypothetical protein
MCGRCFLVVSGRILGGIADLELTSVLTVELDLKATANIANSPQLATITRLKRNIQGIS